LRELCAQLIERIDLFSEQLYAANGYGAPLDYNRVNWTFVERLIDTKNFRWEDYSPVPLQPPPFLSSSTQDYEHI
jgi:hypothetical protein